MFILIDLSSRNIWAAFVVHPESGENLVFSSEASANDYANRNLESYQIVELQY